MKPCRKCGGTEFYQSGSCKACQDVRSRQWTKAHPERRTAISKKGGLKYYAKNAAAINARSIKWAKDNPERTIALRRQRYSENPFIQRARSLQWKQNNRLRCAELNRRWAKNNSAKIRAKNAMRRAQRLSAIPTWFGELDELIMQEAADLCIRRNMATGIKWHVDHIVPLQSKLVCGLHVGANIRVIPAVMNIGKRNRHWPDMP